MTISKFEPGQDTPQFEPAGDFLSVDGVLRSLRVARAPKARQRVAIAGVLEDPTLRPLLLELAPELRERGLID